MRKPRKLHAPSGTKPAGAGPKNIERKHALMIWCGVNVHIEDEYRVEEFRDNQGRLAKRVWWSHAGPHIHRKGAPAIEVFDPESGETIEEMDVDLRRFGKHRPRPLAHDPTIDPGSGKLRAGFRKREYRVVEQRDDRGSLLSRRWQTSPDLRFGREEGPAVENFDPESGTTIRRVWIFPDGVGKHSFDDHPASINIDPDSGVITSEEYYDCGIMHREGGPAEIHRDAKTGGVTFTAYYKDGRMHRYDDRPALEFFSPEGKKLREEYYVLGRRHRENGAAVVSFDSLGRRIPESEEYFLEGKPVNRSDPAATMPSGPELRSP